MFRTSILRAARLPRAAGLSPSSVLASTRSAALRITGTPRVPAFVRALDTPAVLSLSSTSAAHRYYSSAAEAVAEDGKAEAETKAETKAEPKAKFADLKDMGVHQNIVNAITKTMGYKDMTPVQAKTIAPALAGKDMVAQAKTGTGKTLAFLVPVIQRMISENPELAYRGRRPAKADDIRAIILSPTRELAEQISAEAKKLVRDTGVIVQTAVGGTQKRQMLSQTARQGCHLLVATPGRLHDLLSMHNSIIAAPNLSALVLDEADRMLDVGFEDDLKRIVSFLPNREQRPRQTLLFSATIPTNVIMIARAFVNPKNFEFVQTINPDEPPTHAKVPQHIVQVRSYENLLPTMLELMAREIEKSREGSAEERVPFKAIVFLPTTNFVQMTSTTFRHLQRQLPYLPTIYHIHSKLTQMSRTDAAQQFRQARSGILFSSDVTARGMDFPNVTHVIQIGVPPDREQYIHRLGRTGRAEKGGQGWIIVPQLDLRRAREVLIDLPIKRSTSLQSADFDMTKGDQAGVPLAIKEVGTAMRKVPVGLLNDTYMSFLGGGGASRRVTQELIDGLNDWAVHGWGWSQPPAVSMATAQKRGLLKLYGVRIGEREAEMRTARRGSGQSQANNEFQDGLVDEDTFARTFQQQDPDSYPVKPPRPTRSGYGNRGGFGGRGGNGNRGGNRRPAGRPYGSSMPESRASF